MSTLGVFVLQSHRGMDSASEHALIEQCRRQDMEAFGKLVDAYQSRILGFVRRMHPNMEEALDITQEVFIRAFQAFSRFDGRSSLRTWLFRIAHNLCVDRARKAERSPTEVTLDSRLGDHGENGWDVVDESGTPESLLMDQEVQLFVEQAISEMSDKLRSVLWMHDREDMAYEEIAESLGIPVGTVKSRLFLARSYLQQRLKTYLEGEAATL